MLSALVLLNLAAFIPSELRAKAEEADKGVTALKSNITSMELKGYVGNSIGNNITRWQLEAYHENKNIIGQIAWANSGVFDFSGVLGTDYFGVDKYYDIDIADHEDGKALGWTLKILPGSFGDRDLRFVNDPNAVTNWTGAQELWVKVDASQITTPESIRIAFEENAYGAESYSMRTGARVYLVENGARREVSVEAGGYVPLPAGFRGYIAMPLNGETFEQYFDGGSNCVMDLNLVVQFQIAVKAQAGALNKTLYMEEFAIVGNVGGESLPLNTPNGQTYKKVWDLEGLEPKGTATNNDKSSLAWYGEFVGKLLTGMAYSYKIEPSQELKAAVEEIIADLKAAQGEDGYLGVFVGGARFSLAASNWDLWNHYHIITGLLEWYDQTGNADALDIARKAIDCIYEVFHDRSYLVVGGFETNRAIAHGYAQMYVITKEQKYLDEAERIIMQDCQDENGWYKTALRGGRFYTSSSNRWEVLHMIMTLGILYEYTGNQEYLNVMATTWSNILDYDIHNGGGFTTNEAALGNPYLEGVIETCCSIAWAAFTNEFYKYVKTVKVADELERTYYNAILGSLLDTDRVCTYNSPMDGVVGESGGYDGRKVSSQQDISFQFNSGSPDMNCCQANLARGLGQLAEWACSTDGNSLYLNYYGNCAITTTVGGKAVTLTQVTGYPVDGKVVLTVSGLEEDTNFKLRLRIPGWAYGSTVTVDGVKTKAQAGDYYDVEKTWKNGDRIELNIVRSFTYWTGEYQQDGYTSVFYGPILLTLDQYFANDADQATPFSVKDLEAAQVVSGAANDCILNVSVKSGENTVKLVDFASAGKYHGKSAPFTYWSWLTVSDAPEVTKDLPNRWMQSDRKQVDFDTAASCDRTSFYAGEQVQFTVSVPNGKRLESVKAGDLVLTAENGIYTFTMPETAVAVKVNFSEEQSDPDPVPGETQKPDATEPPAEKPASNSGWIAAGVAAAVAAVAGAVAWIFKRKKA